MKTPLTPNLATYLVAAFLVACPLTLSVASTQITVSAANQQVPVKKKEAPVLVRNTSIKTGEPTVKAGKSDAVLAPANEKKVQDKKTIGRYWQRLMNMVREVNHAHRNKRKSAN